jgi:hypothetical protein
VQANHTIAAYFSPNFITVNLKVYLEGPYVSSGDSMRTDLNDLSYLPTSQPYNTDPWNYTGTETVGSIPSGVVDWVLVQLRTDETTTVATRAAFLKSDGSIVDTSGVGAVSFPGLSAGSYFVVIRHRNHLAVMSESAVPLSSASDLYDFTTGSGQYYGAADAAMDLGSGVWGMVGGNADNSDQDIFPSDAAGIRADLLAGGYGYLNTDVDMDGDVFPSDYALCRLNFLAGRFSMVP